MCREAQALAASGMDLEEAGAKLAARAGRAALLAARERCLDDLADEPDRRVLLIRAVRILNVALRS